MNFFKFVDCRSHFLIFDNFYMLAFNARVAQLLNGGIGISAGADDLVKQCGCGSGRSITGGTWL